ncbi:MAG: DUF885 domain-containing protein [Oscillospiraceae bacterium]|jgi:uncharacterized protein (DUF885 family)|nr:DUF885 domain-containing protein [Oscillospiraceae bacterium]
MKKNSLRALALALMLAFTLALSCCGSPKAKVQAEFDALAEEYMVCILSQSPVTVHSLFRNPEAYGFPPDMPISWGEFYTDQDETAPDREKELYKAIGKINRSDLREDQQLTYDVLMYEAWYYDTGYALYYYDEPLNADGSGYHVGLPITLSEYKLQTEKDARDYVILTETLGGVIDWIIRFETEKSAEGLFMTDKSLDAVIEECRAFIGSGEECVLISAFRKNLADMDEPLAPQLQEELCAQVEAVVADEVMPAYERLIKGIEALRGTGVNDAGLSGLPLGREYYEYVLGFSMGVTWSVEYLTERLDNALGDTLTAFWDIASKDSQALSALYEEELGYPELSAGETVELLREKARSDFPALPDEIEYTILPLDPALEDAARPAMYISPQIDEINKNTIIVNEKVMREDGDAAYFFTTMAHEGYPGHLQQFVTAYMENIPALRKVISYQASTEGWATYAEYYSYKYLSGGETLNELARLSDLLDLLLQTRIEIGVSYEGWDYDAAAAYSKELLGYDLGDSMRMIVDYVKASPVASVPYVAGYLQITELREKYSGATDLEFHTEFLKLGSLPFRLAEKRLDKIFSAAQLKSAA